MTLQHVQHTMASSSLPLLDDRRAVVARAAPGAGKEVGGKIVWKDNSSRYLAPPMAIKLGGLGANKHEVMMWCRFGASMGAQC